MELGLVSIFVLTNVKAALFLSQELETRCEVCVIFGGWIYGEIFV